MKNSLQTLLLSMLTVGATLAQTSVTGPSSSQSPYLNPTIPNSTITSIFTATQSIGSYTACGLMDGAGAWDNGNGTFSMLIAHEMQNSAGAVHAHGSTGAFVSKWVINKSTLAVVSGTDLIQNVNLWNGTSYTTYNAASPSPLAAFSRFCSADLPSVSAFWNVFTGNGTTERIFMNGEENGATGRGFAHIATGPNTGTSYELPRLGKFSWENSVASPYAIDKTVVAGMDDATPGQVYFYIGTKTNTGNEVDKAGLTNGKLFGVAVTGLVLESNASVPTAGTTFSLVDLGDVTAVTGASLQTMSTNSGVTQFLRPEDGVWDPSNPKDFYFVTTNGFTANSRLWKLSFTNISNPELGGTITAVLDGSEGQIMMDNIGIDNSGHILIQEDVGNQAHNGKTWQYTIANDNLTLIAQHDPNRFITGGSNFITQDEEASGIFDAQSILGAGMFLFVDQAHTSLPAPVVEPGQMLAMYNPTTATSNPEINLQGNATNITDGAITTSVGDNTNFGTVGIGFPQTKTYVIQNTGTGTLAITQIGFSGANASEFTLIGAPAYPWNIAPAASQTITVQFAPLAAGTRSAMIQIVNTDYSETWYDYKLEGNAVVTTGINAYRSFAESVSLFPNPTKDEATIKIVNENDQKVTINVYDIQGRLVKSPIEKDIEKGESLISINTADLKNGLYFVEITAGNKASKIEMVVSH
ncbi:MAG: choice-of-anchor D domain-containing protein [Bacteroidota bacterium]|nr:choice-of-anchor D domain-containing protein [Bacteroidota bacterium]